MGWTGWGSFFAEYPIEIVEEDQSAGNAEELRFFPEETG